ncbi:DUF2256 domain-containing protein [Silanimonas algicola]
MRWRCHPPSSGVPTRPCTRRSGRAATGWSVPKRESRRPARPSKVCPVCQRPFDWRKKWERDWDRVVYCSDACRRASSASRTR